MKIIRKKHKRGRPRIIYTKTEEKFYKINKSKILQGLSSEGLSKNISKQVFFSAVDEERSSNDLSLNSAMNKVIRRREFSSKAENFEYYKRDVINKTFSGVKKNIKSYLGLRQNQQIDLGKMKKTSEGWVIENNGKSVLLVKNDDTKTEGYKILYA